MIDLRNETTVRFPSDRQRELDAVAAVKAQHEADVAGLRRAALYIMAALFAVAVIVTLVVASRGHVIAGHPVKAPAGVTVSQAAGK